MKLSCLSVSILLISTSSVFAQETTNKESFADALKLDTIVVTANRDIQPREQTNAAITVFTRTDIDRLQPSSVVDLLNKVPGVQITQSGGKGSTTGVFLRGTKTAQTLVLIDGQRVNTLTNGGASLQYLAIDQIERVEVLRGSRSAIYGADAIGGVIQIFTRRADGDGLNARLRVAAGNRSTWERSLGLSGGNKQTKFSLNTALNETQGIDRTRKSFSSDKDHDAYRNKSLSFTISHQLTDDLELGFNTLNQRGRTEYDNPFGSGWPATGTKPYFDFVTNSSSAYVNFNVNDFWTTRLEAGHAEDKIKGRDKLDKGIFASYDYNIYRDSATWLNTFNLDTKNSVLIGLDYLNDKLHSDRNNAYARTSRWNRAGFIQYNYQGDIVFTEIGLRYDKSQQYGSKNTWNASLGFHINPDNQLIFSYAEGFRVPTFNDAYAPSGWGANPNLKPEQSKSYEVQWRSQLAEKTRLEASIYRTTIRDMIVYVSDPITYTGMNYNVEKARINGFEATLNQEIAGWNGALGVSIIDPRDAKTGKTLQNRARRTLNLDIDRQFGDFAIGASWLAVSSSYGDAANNINIPGYGLLGIRGSWQATPEIKFDAKIDNLLDKSYYRNIYTYNSQNYGYREEGITAMLGVTWTPKLF
ncbi:TonB-dependent receptor plug domain-containing protein [Entomomonas asaccharolytica]|uniref:TonB-dependent receptor n=1 Tax=Entomomonas asaccharolytica TaxID=2785331 RepID=A0A974ND34_9GAMM|nr:TonB-dependent receptor [Entomomonas asaccharolytica]QQP84293.1 TonB-dependent receptor [Entomomonas asaccharolytica]